MSGPNKYGAVKHDEDGYTFASGAELRRYRELKLLRDQGYITDLDVHPVYPLVVNGVRVSRYTADFRYVEDGQVIVEDVKSSATKTRDYVVRKKLMKALHGVEIVEVMS